MPEQCRPWGPDCDQPAASVMVAMCCGKEFPLCAEHLAGARVELGRPDMYCLVCGESYTPNTWTELVLDPPPE